MEALPCTLFITESAVALYFLLNTECARYAQNTPTGSGSPRDLNTSLQSFWFQVGLGQS